MKNVFAKIFIKDYQNYQNPVVRNAYGKMCGIIGIISNLILCVIKIVTGLLISSISIMADGINNLADAGSSIITLIGFKLSSMPADSDHPFGHQRIEYISGLIVSFIILIIGFLLGKSSIEKIFAESEMIPRNQIIVTIGILVVAILIKFWQSYFNRKNGKLINSTTLIATSQDSLNDCISTTAVLLSLIVTLIFPTINLDGYMGILVSIFIIISGIKLIKETISPLIGEAPTKEFVADIANKIMDYDGILGIHDLVVHTYGPAKTFVTVHAEVDASVDICISHDIIDNIEHDFMKNENVNLVIHMDPIDLKCEETKMLKELTREILLKIDDSLLFHDFRIVKGPTHTNIIFDVVVPIKFKYNNEEIKNIIDSEFKKNNETYNTVITVDQELIGRREK